MRNLIKGLEGSFGFIGHEYLRTSKTIFRPSFLPFFPLDIRIQRGKQVVFAVVSMHLGCLNGTGYPVIIRHGKHLHRPLPLREVLAFVHFHTAQYLSVTVNSRGFTCSNTRDRKSTRLNSSHVRISYAVFCL